MTEYRYFDVCSENELSSGERRVLELDGEFVLLIRLSSELFAVRNRCTHLDFPLENGRLIGVEIMCRKHGARFDLRDGHACGGPAVNRLTVYPTRIVAGRIQIGVPPAPRAFWPVV